MRLSIASLACITLHAILAQAGRENGNLTMALVRAPPPYWPLPVYTYDWADIMPI